MTQSSSLNRGLVELPIRFIEWWALAGCLVLACVVVMATVSSVTGFLFATPFPGDFELTEMCVAVAAFMFLPYCQLTFAHVSADIFTSKASDRFIRFLSRAGSVLAIGFSLLLLSRTYEGLLDYQTYLETTTILQIPIWYAFVPAICSLALWTVAALITLIFPEKAANSPIQQALGEHH
jgi:TRAP-type C4-dicarboxylate transport system permease small subunit